MKFYHPQGAGQSSLCDPIAGSSKGHFCGHGLVEIMGRPEVACLGCGEERVGKVILAGLWKSVERQVSFFHYSLRAATCF